MCGKNKKRKYKKCQQGRGISQDLAYAINPGPFSRYATSQIGFGWKKKIKKEEDLVLML